MKIEIIAEERQDISRLVRTVTWSGSRINVARKLEVDFEVYKKILGIYMILGWGSLCWHV